MNPEDVLIWVALAALAGAGFFRARSLFKPSAPEGPVQRLVGIATLSLTLALGLLLVYFLTIRLDVEYVFSYTSTDTPWYYRIAGLWGGQKGTLLIWAAASAAVVWINGRAWRAQREQAPDAASFNASLAWTELIGTVVTAGFVILLLLGGLFATTDPFLLNAKPQGTGLQPVLRTPFMLIHPPLQFLGYAVSTVVFALGLTAIITRTRVWADMVLTWARIGFVIATAGLGLGGLWAYYVLNFGGYWAWDPVETANLIAWFPYLLLLHAVIYYRKRGMYAAAAPIFAILTLLADLFSTIATRTGLWVSVHAFTDPSRNFASDPLLRLLNILDTGVLLQGLTAMMVVALMATLFAYLHRLSASEPASPTSGRRWTQRLYVPAALLLLGVAALAVMDVRFVLSAVFEAADVLGFGNAHIGLGILGFGFALVLAGPAMGHTEEPAPRKQFLDYIDMPTLVFAGVLLMSLGFLVVFLLQILSVNGYNRAVYDDRAPIVGLPVLLVLGAAMAQKTIGRRPTVAITGATAALCVAMALVWREHWHLTLLVPAFAWALVGSSIKLFKVSDLGKITHMRLRIAGALLLFGGIVTMVYWANPPTRIPLGFTNFYPSAWWAPVGFLAGLAATLSSVGVLRTATIRAHRIGGVLLFSGIGFGIGSLMGLVALVLGETVRGLFSDHAKAKPIRECALQMRREVRKTGVYLMHVAITLGLLGYALSTYAVSPETEMMLRSDAPRMVDGYELRLVGGQAEGFDADQGAIQEVHALVEIRRGGELLHVAKLTMWLELYHHYAERVAVERFAGEDLYLRPVAFITPERSFVAHEDNVVLTSGQVDAVAITAKTLPGMHLVWGSLWMIVSGMLVNLVASGRPWEFSRSMKSED